MSAATGTSTSPVHLDLGLCKACGICIDLCPDGVFDRDGLGYPVLARPEDCSQCLICELHCPDFAIEVRRREHKRRAADAGALAPGKEQFVAATQSVADEQADCAHDGEEG
jgi:2-oxoglutarate ferredoxin oxidoreductase subunit delta